MWRSPPRRPAPSLSLDTRQVLPEVINNMSRFEETDQYGRTFKGVHFGPGARAAFGIFPQLSVFRQNLQLTDFLSSICGDFSRLIQLPTGEMWLPYEHTLTELKKAEDFDSHAKSYAEARPASPFDWQKPGCQNFALTRHLIAKLKTVFPNYTDIQLANIYYLSIQKAIGNPTYSLWTFIKMMMLTKGYAFTSETAIVNPSLPFDEKMIATLELLDPTQALDESAAAALKIETIGPCSVNGKLGVVKRLAVQCCKVMLPSREVMQESLINPLLTVEIETIIPLHPSSATENTLVKPCMVKIAVSQEFDLKNPGFLPLVIDEITKGAVVEYHKTMLRKSLKPVRKPPPPPLSSIKNHVSDETGSRADP